jgi:hypothetical protein
MNFRGRANHGLRSLLPIILILGTKNTTVALRSSPESGSCSWTARGASHHPERHDGLVSCIVLQRSIDGTVQAHRVLRTRNAERTRRVCRRLPREVAFPGRIRRVGSSSLGPVLQALGLKLIVVADVEAHAKLERVRGMTTPEMGGNDPYLGMT